MQLYFEHNEIKCLCRFFFFYLERDNLNSLERHEARYQRRKVLRLENRMQRNKEYDNFNAVFTPENLLNAFYKCRKGVQWKESVQHYESQLLLNISKTEKQLQQQTFKSKGFVEFTIHERGKVRDIKSVHISERVVQRSLCDNCLIPILRNSLIYDNGASLKGKGIDFTRRRLIEHLRQHIRKYGKKGYVLIMDFKKYFENILHNVLYEQVQKYIKDSKIIALCKQFVDAFGEKGLGLGSQVSQIFALFYVNRFDHFVKEVLRVKQYGRYMDDCYIICATKKRLIKILNILKEKCIQFGLSFNIRKVNIYKLSKGFVFLKCFYTITDSGAVHKRPLQDNIRRQYKKIRIYAKLLEQHRIGFNDIRCSYQSWRGYMKVFNSYYIVGKMNKYYNSQLLGGF